MIARLTGTLTEKTANRAILDVGGVGYEVFIPFSTYYELGEVGTRVTLRIYTHVTENSLALYGFSTSAEKMLFNRLIQISGIGPRLGITILSGLPIRDLVSAIQRSDVARLTTIPGVGRKTAERIALEVKDKVAEIFPELEGEAPAGVLTDLEKDVLSALVNLGYPRNKAETAVQAVTATESAGRFDQLLKTALRKLAG